jgi:hypothetical protein
MTEPDPQAEGRNADFHAVPVVERANWPGPRNGAGRYCWLRTPSGRIGILWTDDDQGLGFMAVSVDRNPMGAIMTPGILSALQDAREAGAEATTVFDAYAERITQGLSADPWHSTTDLASLNA